MKPIRPAALPLSAAIACFACACSHAPAAIAPATLKPLPWAQTQAMLDRSASVWTAPTEGVVSATMTRGPLLGNGAVGVTADSDSKSISLLISHNGFICDGVRAGPARIGGITLASDAPEAAAPFRMEQTLARAEVRARLAGGWTIRSVVAATADVLVTEVANPTGKPLALSVSTWTPPSDATFPGAAGIRGDAAWATRETVSGKVRPERPDGKPRTTIPARWVSRAALATRVLGADAALSADPENNAVSHRVVLAPGASIRIATRIGVTRGESPLEATLAAGAHDTAQTLGGIERGHAAWWKAFWNKSQVVLNDDALERYYYTALYALACANRAGRDAPGLYGSWITRNEASWGGDVHLNYNGQAPYFGVYSANRPELAAPFNASMLAMMPEGRRRAREDAEYVDPSLKGKSFAGILYPVGLCSSLGVASCDRYLKQVYDASFSAMQLIEQYEYTRDDAFLAKEAYPFVRACGDFWESYLEPRVVDGRKQYVFSGGTREMLWGPTPSTDLAFIRRIFTFLLATAEPFGAGDARRAKWRDILDHLPAYPTAACKGKTVIAWDATGAVETHENCFGTDCIYPGDAANLESDPALLELARTTAGCYGAWGHINNMPRLFLARLRVGADPAATREAFFAQVKRGMGPNAILVDPYHGMEKCGGVEVVNRLLMDSDAGVIRLFPDWDRRCDAAFRGLRAKGAFLVNAGLRDGTVVQVEILGEKGSDCTIVNPWPEKEVQVFRNGKRAETVAGGRFTLKTAAGETLGFEAK